MATTNAAASSPSISTQAQCEPMPGPWRWHLRFAGDDRNGSIYVERHPGHAYAIAMQPRYVSNEQWAADAAFIVRAVNAYEDLIKTLKSLRKLFNEGSATLEYVDEAISKAEAKP